jgi:branched-chain amino acid transport system permease protein
MVAIFLLAGLQITGNLSILVMIPVLLLVFLAAMLAMGGLGFAIERVAYRPLRGKVLAPLISALGMSIFLENLTLRLVGPSPRPFPPLIERVVLTPPGLTVSNIQVLILVIAVLLMVSLTWFVNKTIFGMAIRATAEDRDAASLMGIDTERIIAAVFVIGPALGAAGGVLFGLNFGYIAWNTGFIVGLKGFTAAVLGGIGNIQGAMLGGIVLGLIEAFGAGFIPLLTSGLIGPQYRDVFSFIVLVAVLIFRPTGLLGERVGKR